MPNNDTTASTKMHEGRWDRPEPGNPVVFISYHAEHLDRARATSAALAASGVDVLLYDPDAKWADGPHEILHLMLNRAHCIVYIDRKWFKSSWVRMELEFAQKLGIPVLRVSRFTRRAKLVPKITCLAWQPKTNPWPYYIVKYMDQALQNLAPEEVIGSRSLKRWSTGLDLGMRELAYIINRDLRAK